MSKYNPGDKIIVKKSLSYDVWQKSIIVKSNYILTIKEQIVGLGYNGGELYRMEEMDNVWEDGSEIEGLYEEPESINNRFEILDL